MTAPLPPIVHPGQGYQNTPEEQLARSLTERGQQQVDAAVAKASEAFLKRMEESTIRLERDLKERLIQRAQAVVITIVGTLMAAMAVFVWAQARSAQEIASRYQSSVLELQREVMVTQNTINVATRELAEKDAKISAANTELDAARKQLEQTKNEYADRLQRLQAQPRR